MTANLAKNVTFRYLDFLLIPGAIERDRAVNADRALTEMCPQSGLKILLRIGQIAENTHGVVGRKQSLRQEIVLDAVNLVGHLGDAEPMFRQSLSIRKKRFPVWHPRVIYAEIRLGQVLMRERKPDLAEPVLRDAQRSAHSAPFTLLPWQVAEAEDALGRCLVALDRRSEGLALLRGSAQGVAAIPHRSRFR